ncbi:MAG: bifunctional 23S rRNA (guanine(2069)-N(7))-methyltransferase RlmK/23S rRNA (guanine(2445)-N(2))-methyltransferase RlmL [Gammaproteobacteria bacterium]|nr:bifunctional 23S rRNA (guanine(2069)-N(7))-methyltransferase RlmK/23S rRNA (guanine(2445)-N(2))-methyltransferase RlmL [Gammaproteobacteria bacterium]
MHNFFATCPKQLSELLADELTSLGAIVKSIKVAGVSFTSPDLSIGYKACLWSRLANSILYPISTFPAETPEALYAELKKINWLEHFNVTNTFSIEFNSRSSKITHTQYGAQKSKDAIVDWFRDKLGERPNVQIEQPDIKINIHVEKDIATVSIDLSGESLHRRGYRKNQGEAPLKENLAAAILIRSGWPKISQSNGNFVDMMSGAGTLPIEAALMSGNIAPGLFRDYFGFLKWKKFDSQIWNELLSDSNHLKVQIKNKFIGFDADATSVKTALSNIQHANLEKYIHIEKRELADFEVSKTILSHPGLVIANPPYGVRLGESEPLRYLYKNIADNFKKYFSGWKGAIFTGNPDLGKTMGLRAVKYYLMFNGTIECKLLLFDIEAKYFIDSSKPQKSSPVIEHEIDPADPINMFINRIIKNKKHLEKWAKRENITCYRIYDADLPEYAVALDIYENYAHVQEYAAPKTVDPQKAYERLERIIKVLPQTLHLPPENIFYKIREKQTREKQYEKLSAEKKFITVTENTVKYLVNLKDYLDTGLFIDQRLLRKTISELARKKHFLNLFAYTGTASVLAALNGASSTTTVDMSATYLQWAKQNFALNGLAERYNHFIQADCLEWVKDHTDKYDVIFVAPPVFSRSKKMEKEFDLERDQLELLSGLKKNLLKNGKIVFATHKKNFKLDLKLANLYKIEDWSAKMLPMDFSRNKNSFFVWMLS